MTTTDTTAPAPVVGWQCTLLALGARVTASAHEPWSGRTDATIGLTFTGPDYTSHVVYLDAVTARQVIAALSAIVEPVPA